MGVPLEKDHAGREWPAGRHHPGRGPVMQDRLDEVKAQVQTALEDAMANLPPGELTDADIEYLA